MHKVRADTKSNGKMFHSVWGYLLGDLGIHEVPVDQVVEEVGHVGGADVLVVQVVSVLPHILLVKIRNEERVK